MQAQEHDLDDEEADKLEFLLEKIHLTELSTKSPLKVEPKAEEI